MLELKGHEEKKGAKRSKCVTHGAFKNRTTWLELREKEEGGTDRQYAALLPDNRRWAGWHRLGCASRQR